MMLIRCTTLLRDYNGDTFVPEGQFMADVEYNGRATQMEFFVVPNGGPNLVGRDWMQLFNVKTNLINNILVNSETDKLKNKYPLRFREEIGKFTYQER
ncbi:hypothetical protein NQ314_011696 [Rhamnusium bicolor]|uniref:Uncharacterized protein n=1 Tax=Rhamnusium bicolor TaxID=1586634 RepID=A0AAV8XIE8_9CUCU|nr:hypothetical protein NQ314_011696 [Rhamnusium bicolor]